MCVFVCIFVRECVCGRVCVRARVHQMRKIAKGLLASFVCCRWMASPEFQWILVLAVSCATTVVGVLVLSIKSSSRCIDKLKPSALSFCPALVLGVVALNQNADMRENPYERLMELTLTGAAVMHISWVFVMKGFNTTSPVYLMKSSDIYSIFGLAAAIVTSEDHHPVGFIFSLLNIGILILAFHRKSILPILTVPVYILFNHRVILHGTEHVNVQISLITIMYLTAEPLICAFINTTTALDCWRPVFGKSSLCTCISHHL